MQSFKPSTSHKLRRAAVIVESDKKLLVPYSTALTQAGFSPQMISISRNGFSQLTQSPPELLVIDADAPAKAGEQMLNAILRRPVFDKTTIFLLTNNSYLAREFSEKVDLILAKPVLLSNLLMLASRHTLIQTRLRGRAEPEIFDYNLIASRYLAAC